MENYCRNPDGENTMWCYTTDPDTRWERCKPLEIGEVEDLFAYGTNSCPSSQSTTSTTVISNQFEELMKEDLAGKLQ